MSVSIPCAPVAPSTKVKYVVSSVELLALAVTVVASDATVAAVAVPVNPPIKVVDVKSPVLGLYVNPVSTSISCVLDEPSTKVKYTVSLVELLAVTFTVVAAAATTSTHAKLPLPSVCKTCSLFPSSGGKVNIVSPVIAGTCILILFVPLSESS